MNFIKKTLLLIGIVALLSFFQSCTKALPPADYVRVSSVFSNNMVLQREKPIPVWGKASPEQQVKIIFNGQQKTSRVATDSSWRINLDAVSAGGPFELSIIGKDTIRFTNVLVGEVWICSGQSNMEMPLGGWGRINNYQEEIAKADYPEIRLLTIPDTVSLVPLDEIDINPWEECSPGSVELFSATAYFFGRALYKELNVPIGLIHTSWGGTPVEAWMPQEYIKEVKEIKPIVPYEERTAKKEQELLAEYYTNTKNWKKDLAARIAVIDKNNPGFKKPGYKDSKWKTIALPGPWEDAGLGEFDGVVWFRKTFKLKGKKIKTDQFTLSLGRIHDANKTYLNGKLIGKSETRWGSKVQTYNIPPGIVKKGKNTLAVEITNYEWIGGICGEKEELWIKRGSGKKINLAGQWKYKKIVNLAELPAFPINPVNSNQPAVLYNAKVKPLIPYGMRGWIWYQGENNAYENPLTYNTTFPLFINALRSEWNEGDFPFLYVQLANYEPRAKEPGPSNWAIVREAQSQSLALPTTGMAVIIDIGNANDIHPKNKQEVGRRLSLIALNKTYGKSKQEFSAPVYQSMEVSGDTIIVSFTNTGSGIKTSEGQNPTAFAIAGSDKIFRWAETKIVGNKVFVWNSKVTSPVAVRYGWADNPACKLIGNNGLPVSPFRTDNWELHKRE